MTTLQKNIFNIVTFNAVWLLCVLGGSTVAVIAVGVAVAVHLQLISIDRRELLFIGLVGCIGILVEFAFVYFNVLKPPGASMVPPLWLLMLWPLFATTLNHSTRWFQNHPWISVLAGGVAGPLTYLTGTKLTDYEIVAPFYPSMFKLMLVWMAVFPCVILLARKFRLQTPV